MKPSPSQERAHLGYEATIRIMAGLAAGLLGGYVTLLVVQASGFLPQSIAWMAFVAVTFGGFYKGLASAKRRIEREARSKTEV